MTRSGIEPDENTPQTDPGETSLKKLIALGKKRGYLTYDELIEALPQDQMSSEQIEDVMSALSEMKIEIVEDEASYEPAASETSSTHHIDADPKEGWPSEDVEAEPTIFDIIEAQPPNYDVQCNSHGLWACLDHPAPAKLTASFRELRAGANCSELDTLRNVRFAHVSEDQQLTARDAETAGCEFEHLFWAAGMLSGYSPAAAARLTEFAADCLQLLADRVERVRPERETILDTVRASRDFATGRCGVQALLPEIAKAQQAWMRIVRPLDAGVQFPWTRFFSNGPQWRAPAFLPPLWEEWAKAIAWVVSTCLALRPEQWGADDGSWERRKEHEAWLLSRLVHRFAPNGDPAPAVHFDRDPLMSAAAPTETTIQRIEIDGVGFAVIPDSCQRIEVVSASYQMICHLPYSLRTIGTISLYRCDGTITVPLGVTDVDDIFLDHSFLSLPASVTRVGKVAMHSDDDSLFAEGVEDFGSVELSYSYFTFAEGVESIGSLTAHASETKLPSTLKWVGAIGVFDESRDLDDDTPSRTVHWQEGPTEIGALQLGEGVEMTLPRSIRTVASVRLARGAHLKLSQDTIIAGGCESTEGATLERLPSTFYNHVERIDVEGDEWRDLPDTVRTIGLLSLYKNASIKLPSEVVRIDSIELEHSQLELPLAVSKVGRLEIRYSDSSLAHSGVQHFGEVVLLQADFSFAEGVREITKLHATTSSVRLPSTLLVIGDIIFSHEYDDEDYIDWPDGTVEVGKICMSGPTRIRVPVSAKSVSSVHLSEGAELQVSSNTMIVGECYVSAGGRLLRY